MIDLRRMKAIPKKRPRSASDFFSHVDNDGVRAISVLDITHYTWTVGLNAIFSLAGTLSPRLANRQPRENSLTPRGFPCNLALRSVRVPPNPHAGARASRAEPSALAKTNPGLRIKPPETDRTAAPASAAAVEPTTPESRVGYPNLGSDHARFMHLQDFPLRESRFPALERCFRCPK